MPPVVSIIIPCHNAAPWLEACLRSALAQEGAALEVLVIDDGSTDESPAIAERLAGPTLRLLRQPNSGAAAARNRGLQHARGDFIQFLDADDLLLPGKIASQLERLRGAGPLALASARWARFTDDPGQARFDTYPTNRDLNGVEFLQLCLERHLMMHPGAWLAPRSLLDRAGPWDERLSLNDDGEYFARVALASSGILFCPDARSAYRSALPGSLSRGRSPAHLQSAFDSTESICRGLLKADRSERSREAAAHAWQWLAFELYPHAAGLSREAEQRSRDLGGSHIQLPAGPRFKLLSRVIGWRLAKRLHTQLRGSGGSGAPIP